MAGMKFEYDESGAKFVYFVLSFYAMIIFPATYYFWPKKQTKKTNHVEEESCFEPARLKTKFLNKDEPRKEILNLTIKIILLVGWLFFLYLAFKASQIEIEHKEYDPFSILKIDRDATDQEIKKKYRELTKTMHPDRGGDEEKFKELAKAYQALTNEETKKNWIEYGNPDGPGVTQFGIALPKWIVDGKNSYIVLGAYIFVFMIVMPIIVGTWWYKSIKFTGDQVLLSTSQLFTFLIRKSPQMNLKKIIMVLGSANEFEKHSNPEIEERPSDNFEVPQLLKDLSELQEKTRELPYSLPYSLKARALIHAHLSRLNLPAQTLLKDKNTIIKKCPLLINEMINIASNLAQAVNSNYLPKNFHAPKLETIENLMKLSPMIVQALWNKSKSNLLQLPHLEENHLRHFICKKRNISNIKQFVQLNDSERRSILRHLSDEQYDDIIRVCCVYPQIEMTFNVNIVDDEDENTVTAGALVTLVVNLKRENLKVLLDNEESNLLKTNDETIENNELKDDLTDIGISETNSKFDVKSGHKPWEKQKKKIKSGKPKNKSSKNLKQSNNKTKNSANVESEIKDTIENKNDSDDNEIIDNGVLDDDENVSENEEVAKEEKEKNEDKKEKTLSRDKPKNNDNDEYFEKFQQMQKKKEKLETKLKISHRVYCPFYPDIKQECWWLYLADRKSNNIICNPIYICTLKNNEEFELQFMAPKLVGVYTYSVILRSDSYLDFDVIQNLKLDVKPAKKIEEHPQWNFSDDETDKNGEDQDLDDEFVSESENDD